MRRTPEDPAAPKAEDRCVRLVIDFSTTDLMVDFVRTTLSTALQSGIHIYKMTASQFHGVPVGNHYIVAETGHKELRLDKESVVNAEKPHEHRRTATESHEPGPVDSGKDNGVDGSDQPMAGADPERLRQHSLQQGEKPTE